MRKSATRASAGRSVDLGSAGNFALIGMVMAVGGVGWRPKLGGFAAHAYLNGCAPTRREYAQISTGAETTLSTSRQSKDFELIAPSS